MKNHKIFIVLIVLVVIISGILTSLLFRKNSPLIGGPEYKEYACTMEARLCPDGSYVGRIGPNCEFKVCPNGEIVDAIAEVGVGKSVLINGVTITLNKIVQDSRCPVDVTCIWAGNVTLNITLESGENKETRDIVSSETPITFNSKVISIEKVTPEAKSTVTINAQEYAVTFKVLSI